MPAERDKPAQNRIDLLGQTFGRLTVVEYAGSKRFASGKMHSRWLCQCSCGNKTIVDGTPLRSGRIRSCGCLRNEKSSDRAVKRNKEGLINLKGQRFSRWTVKYFVGIRQYTNSTCAIWHCRCDCGNEKDVISSNLRSGSSQSCGCLMYDLLSLRTINHTGQQFARLTVTEQIVNGRDHKHGSWWRCKCSCGRSVIVRASSLVSGETKSCGCWHNETSRGNVMRSNLYRAYPDWEEAIAVGERNGLSADPDDIV